MNKIQTKTIYFKPRAFTIVEVMIAFAIFSLAIAVSVSTFSFFSSKTPVLEGEIFAQQNARVASYILERRLSQAAEILSPVPVSSAEELVFKEFDGRIVKIIINPDDPIKALQSFNFTTGALEPADMPMRVYVKNIEKIFFTALSPAAVMIRVKMKKNDPKAKETGESAFFVRLKNANATL